MLEGGCLILLSPNAYNTIVSVLSHPGSDRY